MSKFNKSKIREELIRRYYFGDYDQSVSREVFDEFGTILMEEDGEAERRAIFEQLWNEEHEVVSDERRAEVLKKIIEGIKKEDGFTMEGSEKSRTTRIPLRKVLLRVAAVVVPVMILIGSGWLLKRNGGAQVDNVSMIIELIANRGETKDTILPDNSKVWVNSGSKIVFHDDNNERRLTNLDGECYFDVTEAKKKQFVVETKNLTVTVLGTKFNIEAYKDRRLTIVTLDEGSLSVNLPTGEEHMIISGQQLIYDNTSGKVEIIDTTEDDEYVMSKWKSGNQICYRMTLEEIFNAIERKYDNTINLIDSALLDNDRTYFAVFTDKDSPSDILQVIRYMSSESFDFSINDNEIMIKTK